MTSDLRWRLAFEDRRRLNRFLFTYHVTVSMRHNIVQVTDKTRGDVQGGTLILYDGRPKLLELSQVRIIDAALHGASEARLLYLCSSCTHLRFIFTRESSGAARARDRIQIIEDVHWCVTSVSNALFAIALSLWNPAMRYSRAVYCGVRVTCVLTFAGFHVLHVQRSTATICGSR